jgi:hypothetical protein
MDDESMRTNLIYYWENNCRGCKIMSCNNSWEEILDCLKKKMKDENKSRQKK